MEALNKKKRELSEKITILNLLRHLHRITWRGKELEEFKV
jgi:hypothetical protein